MMRRGRGRPKPPGAMNKLEAEYAGYLEGLKVSGEVLSYWHESVKIRLANRTWYTPDFMVLMKDHSIEFHETKGFLEDDANVKWKVAAEHMPFPFKMIFKIAKKDGGGWRVRE